MKLNDPKRCFCALVHEFVAAVMKIFLKFSQKLFYWPQISFELELNDNMPATNECQ